MLLQSCRRTRYGVTTLFRFLQRSYSVCTRFSVGLQLVLVFVLTFLSDFANCFLLIAFRYLSIAFCLLLIENCIFLDITYHLQVCLSKISIWNYFALYIVIYGKKLRISTFRCPNEISNKQKAINSCVLQRVDVRFNTSQIVEKAIDRK